MKNFLKEVERMSDRKIRILQSVETLGIGGNELFVMNLFRNIDKEKFSMDFLAYGSRMDFREEMMAGGSKTFVCPQSAGNKMIRMLKNGWYVYKVLKENEYDIVHCNSCSFAGILRAAIPARLCGVKVISHGHNPGAPKNTVIDDFLRSILKVFLSRISDMGFACSDEAGASKFTAKYMKTPKYQVINNAIETEKFAYNPDVREQIRNEYNLTDKFVIGSVGRLAAQKNYLYMIDVLEAYVKINENACLFLAGEGNQHDAIIAKAKEKGVEAHLVMAGKVSAPEKYYQAMDVFVLPSVFEGFGFVNIEAQVSGLGCVVSTAVPKEVDISGRVEFVDFDTDKWCEALEAARRESESIQRKTVVTDKYDINNECRRLEGYYKSLAEKNER